MDCTLKRREILRRRADLRRLRQDGHRVSGSMLYLRFAPASDSDRPGQSRVSDPRIVILLPRGVEGAVRRNRLKRRLREIYRTHKDWFPAGNDYSLHATQGATELRLRHLEQHVRRLCERIPHGG
ncbi:MAG: ribonuclease P protein component [candidate division WOR-3 bacterium]|nr:MAG: ribonuclease P protein component [candidate division WOR-3 bacterium]